jgi:hypothetical protein
MPDFIPPAVFEGVGILAVLTTMLVGSWWMLVRGTLHTDTEYQFVLSQLKAEQDQNAVKDATITEVLGQNRELIEANRTITHALEGFRAAVEAKR